MLNQSTCVGFGYGPCCWGCFLDHPWLPDQSSKVGQRSGAVTTSGPRTINLVAIGYGCRPRLRGRLTLRGLALRRNPWTSGDRVSHSVDRYSCQHARFRYLQRPSRIRLHRPTERSATAPEVRGQRSEIRCRPGADPVCRCSACSIFAISRYSWRHACQLASSM
jgi:hypothetical protein